MLTERQQQVVDAIKDLTAERGYPPTVREVGQRIGLSSSSTICTHLQNLERLGRITHEPLSPRTLRVL